MKLQSFKRLFKTDYKEEFQDLIDKLSASLNVGIESLYDALNGKLSLSDNLYCNVVDIDVIVDSNGIPKNTTSYPITLKTKPIGLQVIDARNLTNTTTYPSGAIFISFTAENTRIIINHITGLQANQTYRLKIITWG